MIAPSRLALILLFLNAFSLVPSLSTLLLILVLARLDRGNWRFGWAWLYWFVGFVAGSGLVLSPIGAAVWTPGWGTLSTLLNAVGTSLLFLFIVSSRTRGVIPAGAIDLGLPLVVGTAVADIGNIVFDFSTDSMRSPLHRLVDSSYYEQIVQLIPVLLIALATEAVFFDRRQSDPERWLKATRTLVVVVVCSVGEVSALLMLIPPVIPANPGDFFRFLEALSFRYSLQGTAMALASFAWAIAARARQLSSTQAQR